MNKGINTDVSKNISRNNMNKNACKSVSNMRDVSNNLCMNRKREERKPRPQAGGETALI